MRFKLDENLGVIGRDLLVAEGHDVSTVYEQGLTGASDDALFPICCDEQRTLVSLDLDFAQFLRFPTEGTAGIVIIRQPGRLSVSGIEARVRELVAALPSLEVAGRLIIVEPGRIRVRGV